LTCLLDSKVPKSLKSQTIIYNWSKEIIKFFQIVKKIMKNFKILIFDMISWSRDPDTSISGLENLSESQDFGIGIVPGFIPNYKLVFWEVNGLVYISTATLEDICSVWKTLLSTSKLKIWFFPYSSKLLTFFMEKSLEQSF